MYNKRKISVVLPAYNEEKYIGKAVKDFLSTKVCDEILVIDNNSKDGTAKIAKESGATVIKETRQGYGWALRRGLHEAKGDYIVTCEPDGTFVAKDIFKLLTYAEEFDAVFGTRTSKEFIWSNANMDWFLRLGNVFIAKLLEYLHNGPCFTDVGCTFKLIKKPALAKIQKKFTVGGSSFSPEFMILCIKNKIKVVEIPLNYRGRVGESKITGKRHKAFTLGLRMIWLVIRYIFKK